MPILDSIAGSAVVEKGIKPLIEGIEKKALEVKEGIIKDSNAISGKLEVISCKTAGQLEEFANNLLEQAKQRELAKAKEEKECTSESDTEKQSAEGKEGQEGLTDEEKQKIKEETGWSDEIIDAIENMDQYEIYKNAGLHEEEINGRKCLVKDIDMDYVDPKTGMTNRERMERGLSPIDSKTGEKIELHHMGQKFDAPFAELSETSEHGDGKHKTLHTSTEDSWRNDPEKNKEYNTQRKEHWEQRVREATQTTQEG